MNCSICSHSESRVLHTDAWKRRRACCRCGHRWTTVELPLEQASAGEMTGLSQVILPPATLGALVAIARAAAGWGQAVRRQSGRPEDRSLLADRLTIALERAGLL